MSYLCCSSLLPHHHIGQQCRNNNRYHARNHEDQVGHNANPFDELDETATQEGLTARVPVAIIEDIHHLQDAAGEKSDEHHQYQANVQAPESNADIFLDIRPLLVIQNLTQGKGQQSETEHSKNTHQRGVTVIGREHRADFIVTDNRHVDEKAEHARADEVPEADRDEEIERPLVRHGDLLATDLTLAARQLDEIPGVEREQG